MTEIASEIGKFAQKFTRIVAENKQLQIENDQLRAENDRLREQLQLQRERILELERQRSEIQ